jgi:hypothetical protein
LPVENQSKLSYPYGMKPKVSAPSKRKIASTPAILVDLENKLKQAVYSALDRKQSPAQSDKPGNLPGTSRTELPANARLAPSHDEIAIRAQELWREMGCPQGHDKEIWLAAERRLCGELRREKEESDRRMLLEQLALVNHVRMDNVMDTLERLYPGATGISTTSL